MVYQNKWSEHQADGDQMFTPPMLEWERVFLLKNIKTAHTKPSNIFLVTWKTFGLWDPPLGWGNAATQSSSRNLNLPICIKWHARRGLLCRQLDPLILQLLRSHTPPDFLVIHLGSNDLTTEGLTSKTLIQGIQCTICCYNALLPKTKLIWSSISPRLYWHGAPLKCGGKFDKKRRNRKIKPIVWEWGYVIAHNNISDKAINLFRYEGGHLSEAGNELYLMNLHGGFSHFCIVSSTISHELCMKGRG